jgi:hypothetical protein
LKKEFHSHHETIKSQKPINLFYQKPFSKIKKYKNIFSDEALFQFILKKRKGKKKVILKTKNKKSCVSTLDNGYLGFRNDEERSKLRYLV